MSKVLKYQVELEKNKATWDKKPALRHIYQTFYKHIHSWITYPIDGKILEIGSGIGAIKQTIPECICSDLFYSPRIDFVGSAYDLPVKDHSLSNIILFDVFHHLQFPGMALKEFKRVLISKGRVVIFEPYISLLGLMVYGFMHKEPVHWYKPVDLGTDKRTVSAKNSQYYAAQGNATKLFFSEKYRRILSKSWHIVSKKRISGFSYVLSGGYSAPQLYPDKALALLEKADQVLDFLPAVFATRALIVLEIK